LTAEQPSYYLRSEAAIEDGGVVRETEGARNFIRLNWKRLVEASSLPVIGLPAFEVHGFTFAAFGSLPVLVDPATHNA
jgi:hypothetical protein